MYIVYLRTNKLDNDKVYVGYTSFTLEKRWEHCVKKAYRCILKRDGTLKKRPQLTKCKLSQAIITFGGESNAWDHEILETHESLLPALRHSR